MCVIVPNVTPCKSKHSPEGRDVALLDSLTQSSDAFDGVGATALERDVAELVVVQTAAKHTSNQDVCDMAQCHTTTS